MGGIMSFISEYGVGISLLFQFILALLVLWLKDKFAPVKLVTDVTNLEKEIKGEMDEVKTRVQSLENQQKNSPTKDDFHRLEKSVLKLSGEFRGELKRVDESLDGAEGLIERLEKQVNRMDKFWRATK